VNVNCDVKGSDVNGNKNSTHTFTFTGADGGQHRQLFMWRRLFLHSLRRFCYGDILLEVWS